MKHSAKSAARKKKMRTKRTKAKPPTIAKSELRDAQQELKTARSKRIVLGTTGNLIEIIPVLDREWAELLLSNLSPNQRNVRSRALGQIERALVEGTFVWTGEPIQINTAGDLINGRHRVTAVYNTGIPMHNVVLATVQDPNVERVLDTTSAARSLGDIHRAYGKKTLSNTVHSAILYEHADFNRRTTRSYSKPEKFKILQEYDLRREAVELHNAGLRGMRVTSGPIAGALRCVRKNHSRAMLFFTAAFSNTHYLELPTKKGSDEKEYTVCPQAALLANWLVRVREMQLTGKGRTSGEEFVREGAIKAVKAWNAYRMGRNITALVLPRDKKIPTPRK